MARDLVKAEWHDLADLVGSIARDTERLLGQHVDLLRSDVQHVAAPLRLEEVGRLEQLAQPRYLVVETVRGCTRRPLTSGAWWRRERRGLYMPVLSLRR